MKKKLLAFIALIIIIIGLYFECFGDFFRIPAFLSFRHQSKPLDISDHIPIIPIAIIGSGPAGLSAALFTAREGYHTAVFEGPKPGGQITNALIENWPGIMRMQGQEIVKTLQEQAKKFGAYLIPDTIVKVNFSQWPYVLFTEKGLKVKALSVIIATGAWPKKLYIPGEQEYWGKGVAICTLCDAPSTKNQDVVIIGGGQTAVNHAIHLAPYAKKITIATKDTTLSAPSYLTDQLKEYKNIEVIYDIKPTAIMGDKEKITEIQLQTKDKHVVLPTQWVFLAVGYEPNSAIFKPFLKVDQHGIIQVAPYTQETSVPGIYAAGKVANARYKLGAIASGEGIKAGLDAINFLEMKSLNVTHLQQYKNSFFIPTNREKETKNTKQLLQVATKDELQEILKNNNAVVLEFFSPACPHCQAMQPIVEKLAAEMTNMVVVQCDINKGQNLTKEYDIRGIPTFVVFKDQKEVGRKSGEMSFEKLKEFVEKLVS